MKVIHVSSVHTAKDVRIFFKECISLAESGYAVSILTADGTDGVVESGVSFRSISKTKGRFDRMVMSQVRMLMTAWSEKADVYHIHDPELLVTCLVLSLAGKRVIYDVHEDLRGQILEKYWIPSMIRKPVSMVVHLLELFLSTTAWGIVAATPEIANKFKWHSNVTCVQNFPKLSEYANATPCHELKAGMFTLVYAGGIMENKGFEALLDSFDNLPKQIRLLLIGDFCPEGYRKVLESHRNWKRVDYRGVLSRAEVLRCYQSASLGIALDSVSPNNLMSYPTKIFEYMALGLPSMVSCFPLWRDIVEKGGAGFVVQQDSANAIADKLQWCVNNPKSLVELGARGRKLFFSRYNWEHEQKKLLLFYGRLIG